jgi:uncharacterized membrane protein
MSQTFVTVFVMVLTNVLPKLGITVGNAELTTTMQTLVYLVGCAWILVRRYQAGGVSVVGLRK